MPQFLPAGYGQARILFRGISATSDSVVTFGYKQTATEDPAEHAEAFYNALVVTGGPFVVSAFTSAYTFTGVYCTWMTETGPLVGEFLQPITGTNTLQAVPANCAFLLRKSTALGGRKGRGRAYLPPIWIAEGSIGPTGAIAGADATTVLNKWNAFKTALTTAGFDLRLIHTEAIIPTLITAFSVDTTLATQRRRMRK